MILAAIVAVLLSQTAAATAPSDRCLVPVNGGREMQYIGDRRCYDFDPQRGFIGIWVNQFEGSMFFPGARSAADVKPRFPNLWLTVDDQTSVPKGVPLKSGHGYFINFTGRRAKARQSGTGIGFGHLGESEGVIVVDRVLSIRDLGLLPPNFGWPPIEVHQVR